MDQCSFEQLEREVGAARGRRETVRIVIGSLVASLPLLGKLAGESSASQLANGCRLAGQKCDRDDDCCGGSKCKDHRCKCISNGKSCLIVIDEASGLAIPNKSLCCTAKCSRKRHKCT